jgi:hypothetical protein
MLCNVQRIQLIIGSRGNNKNPHYKVVALELTVKSPKVETNSTFPKDSPIRTTSNTCVSDLFKKKNPKEGGHFALLWGDKTLKQILWEVILLYYMSLILLEEYVSDERSKETHMLVGGPSNNREGSYRKIKTC